MLSEEDELVKVYQRPRDNLCGKSSVKNKSGKLKKAFLEKSFRPRTDSIYLTKGVGVENIKNKEKAINMLKTLKYTS